MIPDVDLTPPNTDEEEEEEEDMEFPPPNGCQRFVTSTQQAFGACFTRHSHTFRRIFLFLLLVVFLVYFGFAMAASGGQPEANALIGGVLVVALFCIWEATKNKVGEGRIKEICCKPFSRVGGEGECF